MLDDREWVDDCKRLNDKFSKYVIYFVDGTVLKIYDPTDPALSKAMFNIIGNATSAILNRPPGTIYKSAAMFDLEVRMLQETLAVMDKLGLKVLDLPGSPAKRLAKSVRRVPKAILKPILTRLVASGRGDKMPSFHIDLTAGTGQSEVVYHNGAIAQAGLENGIPTPVNAVLNDVLMKLTRNELDWREFDGKPRRLLQEVKNREEKSKRRT